MNTITNATNVYHGKSTGRFYFGNKDQQDQVYLYTPAGNISELWDAGESSYDHEMLPTEVLGIIEDRTKSRFLDTRREEKLKTIAAIQARGPELDRAWLEKRVEKAREILKKLEMSLQYHIESMEST